MLFNSYSFLVFFPIVVLITFIIPSKFQYIWLLLASYVFYMNWDARYALLLLFSTAVTYISGLLIEAVREKAKWVVAASFCINLSILFFFKYFNFAFESLQYILGRLNIEIVIPHSSLLLPVGISFYIFQALSYTVDVYRGDVQPEKNFFKYALFVSFFPQLVAGPIERSKNLLLQINKPHFFDYDNMRSGLLTMLWGYFLKLVIADRIAMVVDEVYGNVTQYNGVYFIVASVLFAIQIYCDFAGYSTIAIGAARVLGFKLMENFNSPYLAVSIKDFWRRWHISLSSWFRDYLYIPLGGSRVATWRKYCNILIVFMVSGLWHGAAGTFIVWGLLHGIYQVIGGILIPVRKKISRLLHINPDFILCRIVKIAITFVLVDIAWIFFRADSFSNALYIIDSIFHTDNWALLFGNEMFMLGLSHKSILVAGGSILLLFVADILKNHGVDLQQVVLRRHIVIRWFCYYAMILIILIFGIWGTNYDAAGFIYFQF